jgi:uncharacterized cupredoxin-like copper-binding protein
MDAYIFRVLVCIAVFAVTISAKTIAHEPKHGGHEDPESFSAGQPGDAKKATRTIEIEMGRQGSTMFFRPNSIEVRKGEQIRFVLKNVDQIKDHEFVLATEKENLEHAELMKTNQKMQHDDPNGKSLNAKETKELVWRFTKAGEFEFSCNLPGHREAGMVGKVSVK